jgi:prophage regulatory protein
MSFQTWNDTLRHVSENEAERRLEQSRCDRILRDAEVRERTGLSRTTRWRLIKAGEFPSGLKLTEHAVGWRESDIDAWLASRQNAA